MKDEGVLARDSQRPTHGQAMAERYNTSPVSAVSASIPSARRLKGSGA
ncbi:MAG: hypothetical protein R6V86_13560 [Spirochaetia bacterium]